MSQISDSVELNLWIEAQLNALHSSVTLRRRTEGHFDLKHLKILEGVYLCSKLLQIVILHVLDRKKTKSWPTILLSYHSYFLHSLKVLQLCNMNKMFILGVKAYVDIKFKKAGALRQALRDLGAVVYLRFDIYSISFFLLFCGKWQKII